MPRLAGEPRLAVRAGLGIALRYRQAELPCFEWKMVCAGTYVRGSSR